ncbi:hypothetical protein RND81_01G217200 [Saponaria officinalis]|uniref:C2H2-type domain-containing protein n=1 Tax=Saponaria officinalis TaxID=3572 RepID=A0AAW1NK15_SAPOF
MAKNTNPRQPTKEIPRTNKKQQPQPQQQQLPSWAVMKNILTCKHLDIAKQPPQQQQQQQNKKHRQKPPPPPTTTTEKPATEEETSNSNSHINNSSSNNNNRKSNKKMRCSGSLCNNTKVMHRPEPPSPETRTRKVKSTPTTTPTTTTNQGVKMSFNTQHVLTEIKTNNNNINNNVGLNKSLSSNSSANYVVKGMPFRRLTGCYECRMIVDPVLAFTRDPSLRSTICSCSHCGEVFMKPENLELHQAVRHAVSELGADDTSKNIVEIIFQSSWLMKQIPVCKIDRILKVHNTQRTINKFEEYRDLIKFKATNLPKKHPRCIADGNELLRFYCTTFKCTLGLNGSSNLCNSIPHCNICGIIKNGFKLGPAGEDDKGAAGGILTTASSGRAHERARVGDDGPDRRAMLVCRVIAGRVKGPPEGPPEECDSVAEATTGVYSNLDELYVFNPRAILPCFVVIYGGF